MRLSFSLPSKLLVLFSLALSLLGAQCNPSDPTMNEKLVESFSLVQAELNAVEQATAALSAEEIAEPLQLNIALTLANIDLMGRTLKTIDMDQSDISQLVLEVMLESAKVATEELRALLEEMKDTLGEKRAQREKLGLLHDRVRELGDLARKEYIAVHELGHAGLNIVDEYIEDGQIEWGTDEHGKYGAHRVFELAKPGTLDVSFTCLNDQRALTIELWDLVQDQALGMVSLLSTDFHLNVAVPAATLVALRLKSEGFAIYPPRPCVLRAVYPRRVDAKPKPWEPVLHRTLTGQLGGLQAAYADVNSELAALERDQDLTSVEARLLAGRFMQNKNRFMLLNSYLGQDLVWVPLGETADQLDTLADLGELIGMRLQKLQERREKVFEKLSSMMKKLAETQSSIIGNLK